MNHRESGGIGKHAQNLLSQDAIGGAERVPTGAQEHDLYRLLFERLLICHLDIAQLVFLRSTVYTRVLRLRRGEYSWMASLQRNFL